MPKKHCGRHIHDQQLQSPIGSTFTSRFAYRLPAKYHRLHNTISFERLSVDQRSLTLPTFTAEAARSARQ